jgi:tRNA A37 methylthiotransferase MiaB
VYVYVYKVEGRYQVGIDVDVDYEVLVGEHEVKHLSEIAVTAEHHARGMLLDELIEALRTAGSAELIDRVRFGTPEPTHVDDPMVKLVSEGEREEAA